ncbi:MAG: hypothetical protein CMP39_01080 [Rickettsiales bacterium]|nr:hypothetical protein [Rickettsiales bacterium]|tara:strand:- start:901 stop:1344 length:444 start_codon:yes stop_codon:yes gene_type:complete
MFYSLINQTQFSQSNQINTSFTKQEKAFLKLSHAIISEQNDTIDLAISNLTQEINNEPFTERQIFVLESLLNFYKYILDLGIEYNQNDLKSTIIPGRSYTLGDFFSERITMRHDLHVSSETNLRDSLIKINNVLNAISNTNPEDDFM